MLNSVHFILNFVYRSGVEWGSCRLMSTAQHNTAQHNTAQHTHIHTHTHTHAHAHTHIYLPDELKKEPDQLQ